MTLRAAVRAAITAATEPAVHLARPRAAGDLPGLITAGCCRITQDDPAFGDAAFTDDPAEVTCGWFTHWRYAMRSAGTREPGLP